MKLSMGAWKDIIRCAPDINLPEEARLFYTLDWGYGKCYLYTYRWYCIIKVGPVVVWVPRGGLPSLRDALDRAYDETGRW